MHEQARHSGGEHRQAQDAGENEAPGIGQMQPDMQLYEKSSKRGGGIGREHVQPKTLAARHDAVIGSYLEQHSFFLWLGRRL